MSEAATIEQSEVNLTPEQIRADVKNRLASKARGLPHWPNDLENTIDHGLRAKHKDLEFIVDNLDKAHTEITQDERLSQQGKTEKLTELQQLALSKIESKNNTLSAEQNAAKLRNSIAAKTDAALNAPGWLARQQQILQWTTALSPPERIRAWSESSKAGDTEFREALALTSPTIRRVLMPSLTDAKVAEIKAGFTERFAGDEVKELTTLTTEIDVLKKAVAAALHRARVKLHAQLN